MDPNGVNLVEAEGRTALTSWQHMTHMHVGATVQRLMQTHEDRNRIRFCCCRSNSVFELRCDGETVDQIHMIRLVDPTPEGLKWFWEWMEQSEKPHTLVMFGDFAK